MGHKDAWKVILIATALIVAILVFRAWALDRREVSKLSPVHQALYGAMKVGWIIGANGGGMEDLDQVFLVITNGDTNAVDRWLAKRRLEKSRE